MSANASGTPTTNFSIPKFNTAVDEPNGKGTNEMMDAIDTLLESTFTQGGILKSTFTAAGDILYATGSATPAKLAKGTDGQVLTLASGLPSWATTASTTPDYIQLQYHQSSGTQGGTASTGAWTKYPLNTKVTDTGSHVSSFTSNQFVLDAGTYLLTQGYFVCLNGAHVVLRLRNTTGSATLVVGCSSAAGSNNGGFPGLSGEFTVAAAQTLELEYWASNGANANDLGYPATTGEVEVYGSIDLLKMA